MPGVVYRGDAHAPRIALTFDACSTSKNAVDEAVLSELTSLKVPATLFLGGRWLAANPDALRRMRDDPDLELGLHGYRHPHYPLLSDAALETDLSQGIDAYAKALGHPPALIRAPYGEIDARVAKAMREHGLTPVQYSLASGDPDPSFSKAVLVRWVVGSARPGSIVVMHINGNGKHTGEALPDIVQQLRAKGFELVTVSALMGRDRARAPEPKPSP